jgi:hypothetical protein
MSNGDPLLVGRTQPPDNRATAATMLVHTGSAVGAQQASFWVQRGGALGDVAIRGENFSTSPGGGQTRVGVMGMVPATGDVGVLGTIEAGSPGVMFGEIGVMGFANTAGVVGKALGGIIEEGGEILGSSAGVYGEALQGTGVQGFATSGFGVVGQSTSRAGVTGASKSAAGVEGNSTNGVGVAGQSANTIGVWGSTNSGFAGVLGYASQRYGVIGESAQGIGVFGQSPTNAVRGVSNGPSGASIGVAGVSDKGTGVQGDSNYIGVGGRSTQGAGGWFTGPTGVLGISQQGYAVVGRSKLGVAGFFQGQVLVQGSLQVTGAKSAVVKHTDGSYRALFCVESAESMLQDFGEVTLRGESVFVKLGRDFAPLMKRDKYQVFLTAYGPEAVYVRKRTRDGFEIARHTSQAGVKANSVLIGYSIVGKRADLMPSRLPKVKLPAPPATLTAPKIQKPATPSALVKKQKPGAVTLPPQPKIATPNLKELSKSAPPVSASTKKANRNVSQHEEGK